VFCLGWLSYVRGVLSACGQEEQTLVPVSWCSVFLWDRQPFVGFVVGLDNSSVCRLCVGLCLFVVSIRGLSSLLTRYTSGKRRRYFVAGLHDIFNFGGVCVRSATPLTPPCSDVTLGEPDCRCRVQSSRMVTAPIFFFPVGWTSK